MGKRTNTAKWVDQFKYWKINVQKDGERRSFYSSIPGRNGQREANKKADEWLDEGVACPNVKCEALFESYISDRKQLVKLGTWRQEECYYRVWISPVIGSKKAGSLCDDHVQTILDNAFKAGLSKKTILNIKATAFSFIKYCRRKKATNYVPDEVFVRKDARVGEKSILQPTDLATLFSSDKTTFKGKITKDPYIHAYRFMVLTGCRPGELYGLERADREGNIVHIRRSINEKGEITNGKNSNALRSFQMTKSAIAEWDAQVRLTPFGTMKAFYDDHPKAMLRYWQRYCKHNKIPYVTLYELRHTFISIIKELPEGWLKSLVGHSKIMDSFGVYGHEVKGEQALIASKIENIFQDILSSETNAC